MLRFRHFVTLDKLLPLAAIFLILGAAFVLGASRAVQSQAAYTAIGAVGTAFTYQGRLNEGNTAAHGQYDFQFGLYDAETGGNVVGVVQTKSGVSVVNGAFTVVLDFGSDAFGGAPRWLEIGVRKTGVGNFIPLTPRQPLTPVPYAMYADLAGRVPWSGIVEFGAETIVASNGIKITSNANTGNSYALAGFTQSPDGFGILGRNQSSQVPSTGYAWGVYGQSDAPGGRGVEGYASQTIAQSIGVAGFTESSAGYGVFGRNKAGNIANGCCAWGVYGYSDATDGTAVQGFAVGGGITYGVGGFAESPSGVGVYGNNTTTGVKDDLCCGEGVYGISDVNGGIGVHGYAASTVGTSYGVAGYANSPDGAGIYGDNKNTKGFAAKFNGKVDINGALTKRSGSFKIDHPLDPENKYLYHSFVESPDMMNIYNGNVTLDSNGEAWVVMPAWFEALNIEFRYQLTAIGAPGPNLYIAQKIINNQFKIAGGQAGLEVSWQVTGIRNDPYARAHRIVVEEEKRPGERGAYLSPEEYGQPETRGLNYRARQSEGVKLSPKRQGLPPDISASLVITDNRHE